MVPDIEIVLQPIVDVSAGSIVAAEALARFPGLAEVPVGDLFAQADGSGDGAWLQARCLEAALQRRAELPAGVLLAVNVSPDAMPHPVVQEALAGDLSGVIIELTEQYATEPDTLHEALVDARGRGALLAIDDASSGYAGLLRLATLRPDIVKLDRGLVAGARYSVEQSAVIEALVSLSRRIGARVLGEGVETRADLIHLAALDVDYAQGWAIAPPAATLPAVAEAAAAACRDARAELLNAGTTGTPLDSMSGVGGITAALAGSVHRGDLHAVMRAAALSLGVDAVSLSTLNDREQLREISSTGASIDELVYALSDYPETRNALDSDTMIEAHVSDAAGDAAERGLLVNEGFASLLLTPVMGGGIPLGILEFRHRTHRRWTNHDMTQARTLADHVASALLRMHKA